MSTKRPIESVRCKTNTRQPRNCFRRSTQCSRRWSRRCSRHNRKQRVTYMTMRVATFAVTDQMIAGALRTQATMANMQVQEASGLKSEYLADYGVDSQHIINLQVS